jgi:ATP-binding cassette, subfamily B, bacterial MsbA
MKKTKTIDYSSSVYLVKRIIINYIKPHLLTFLFAIFLMFIIAGATAGQAWLIKPALDVVFVEKKVIMLTLIPIGVIIIAIIKGLATYGQTFTMALLTSKIRFNIQKELYRHFLYSDMAVLNKNSSGYLMSSILNDVNGVMSAVTLILTGAIKEFFTIASLIIVMFMQNVELSLIAFIAFPLAFYPMINISRKLRKISIKNQSSIADLTSQMNDTLQYTKLVKSYNAEEFECNRLNNIIENLYAIMKKMISLSLISSPLIEMLGTVGVAGVIWYGGWKVLSGTTTVGAFFSFFGAMLMAYRPMKSISGLNVAFQGGMAASQRIFELMDEKPLITDKPDAVELKNVKGHIEFKQVDFEYVSTHLVLSNVNINIPAGKTVALVGHSGGGKSTIMSLILRFYDVTKGGIYLDEYNIKDIKLTSLRNSIAFVSQEVQLFDDTIRENIRYAKVNATDKDIQRAAEFANAHEFIMELPQGYDTKIGQQGIRLSGGQRQRISIARAILCNAPILLLDEATSSLDPISEKLIQNALDKLMKNRTTLVIAHRLSTVINAEKICVMDHGKIVEEGSHTELMEKNGVYATLYSKQFEIENIKVIKYK